MDLESLVKSSRIFRELEFFETEVETEMIEEFIQFTGSHIKKFFIKYMKVDPKFFQLLNLLPNLEALELDHVQINDTSEGPIKWALKSSKIKRILINYCPAANFESLLEFLEKCVIEEALLGYPSSKQLKIMEKLLKSQEKNLKKLTIDTCCKVPSNLKDLRLEYLDIKDCVNGTSLEFLKQQADLKVLKISGCQFSSQDLSMICELKQLETLELYGSASQSSGLNKLYQLGKLKRLRVGHYVCDNILDHLKFGVFNDLEELFAAFEGASMESFQEMKRITPNLKKILIHSVSSDIINALLEALENLEKAKFWQGNLELSSEKVYPNMKHLDVYPTSCPEYRAAQLTHQFPNLEFLKIYCVCFEVMEPSFIELLSGLKRLKTLEMDIKSTTKIDSEFVLPCFEKYGSHLETVKVNVRAVQDPHLLKERFGVIGFTIEKKIDGFCFDKLFGEFDPEYDLI